MTATQEEIASAKAYEELHVPALFGQWSPRILDAIDLRRGERFLDVACGTGVLAREAARRVGDDGFVSGVDVGAGMVAVARQLAPEVDWRQAAAEALPYDNDSFDAVACQFGLMFFADRVAALREMLRVTASEGRVALAVWEDLERSEAYPIEVELLERLAGRAAADALRAPFVLGDKAELASLFERAGAANVEISTPVGRARFPSIRTMVEADLRGWLPVMGVNLDEELIETILQAAEEDLAGYRTADGVVEFAAPAHLVTATPP